MIREQRKDTVPWYRQPMPIFIFSLPLAAVIASFVSMGLAVHHQDALVSGDYYKQGIAVNERIEKDEAAARGNIAADVSFVTDGASSTVLVNLTGHPELLASGGTPVLKLLHPTDDQQDMEIKLESANVPGWWKGSCPSPSTRVVWHMTLENLRWRIGTLAAVHPSAGVRLVSLAAPQ